MRARVELPVAIVRSMGPLGVVRRARYIARHRLARLPVQPSRPVRSLRGDWSIDDQAVRTWWASEDEAASERARARSERILDGHIPVFGRERDDRFPPTWRPDEIPRPWTAYSDASDDDIKDTWEPSRFGFLGPLVRGRVTGDAAAMDQAFDLAVADWIEHDPAFYGENWMCGQESSLRALTILFYVGMSGGLANGPPERRQRVEQLVSHTVERVAPTLGYARSQRNNHAISEAVFLLVASMLLADGDRGPRRRAERALRSSLRDQFAEDGSYAQYSFTYQRLALHTLLLLDLVARSIGQEIPSDVERVFESSFNLLARLIDPESGSLPNAGGNDGALLLDLTDRPIEDFRPLVAHLAARLGRARPFPAGAWDEEAAWFGHDPPPSTPPALGVCRTWSYHALRSERVLAVMRAGRRRHRPAHADMLHVDIRIDGRAAAFDAGTYRYTAPEPWGNALVTEDVHNVARLPAHPQGVRAGRFLWRSWRDAVLVETADPDAVRATLDLGGASITRTLRLWGDAVVVVDEATEDGMVVRWNLPEDLGTSDSGARGVHFVLRVAGGRAATRERSLDVPSSGWHSPTYGELMPCTALELTALDRRIVSVFAASDEAAQEALGRFS